MIFLTQAISTKDLALLLMAMKKHLYTFVLLVLLAFKVTAITAYFHCSDETHFEDCELCEHAIQNQNVSFLVPPQTLAPKATNATIFCQGINHYETTFIATAVDDVFYGRPPPFLHFERILSS